MTINTIPFIYDFVVQCDKKGCDAHESTCINAQTHREQKWAEASFLADLGAAGWTTWAGMRTPRRDYCPAHGPDPRSAMWEIKTQVEPA